jgi:predicted helicase
MSKRQIHRYRAKVEKLIQYGGSRNEMVLRKAFQELLDNYARGKNLVLVPEIEYITPRGYTVYPDGTLKDALRQSWGFWESKDEKDNLDDEIKIKFAKGYPKFNILFEDTKRAVLYQDNEFVMEADFDKDADLDELLKLFVSYEPREVREFHKAIELFTEDVPNLAQSLREIIEEQIQENLEFKSKLAEFLVLCQKAINPNIEMADVREMIIQHILTEDIFMRVFNEADFHRENAIAHRLQELARTFYTGTTKRNIHSRTAHYYETINAKAAQISDHHEKQKFLKALYESFYRAYNPKAADRLGVMYTPDEIVEFMVEGTDYLLNKHFGKTLGEQYVEILDPATGTGTFITEIIEYLPLRQLQNKYENEIHCNEVAILPYYIANLNIEFSYKQKVGKYKEFENICFVDTLDNVGFSRSDTHQMDFFGIWDENAERIGRQNTRKISVIIGNPPYNANQLNENENNKNREYPEIDKRISETYVAESTAQKTKLYDMYARFLRWASDRISQNGIIAFVSNSSFLDARSFDGFRKVVSKEFNDIYVVNLKGDARTSGKRRQREGGNVFSDKIRVGIAIYFLVKKINRKGFRIHYNEIGDYKNAHEKQEYLVNNTLPTLKFENIVPDMRNNWLNQPEHSWDELIPIASKEMKSSQRKSSENTVFEFFSLGVITSRDDWVYDFSKANLKKKIRYFINEYNKNLESLFGKVTQENVSDFVSPKIKWSRAVKKDLINGHNYHFKPSNIIKTSFRPFSVKYLYYTSDLNEMQYQMPKVFNGENFGISISGMNNTKPFTTLVTDKVLDYHFIGDTQFLPFYNYNDFGERVENITDNGLFHFQTTYNDETIAKIDIFHYVYGILHNPTYREKYYDNLQLDFPRIPIYDDFWQWAELGKKLMDLHLNYEKVEKFNLQRVDIDPEKTRKAIVPKLKTDKENGVIEIDTLTTLTGVPKEGWEYKLGTYSAMGWILDQYKEKKPRYETIREKFDTYKFFDYKEEVIDLLMRVCTVSVETMRIIKEMVETGEG